MDEKQRIVTALYAATGQGDWAAAEAHLTHDFFITEAEGLPFSGVYRGRGALRKLYTKVLPMLRVEALDLIETTTGAEHAVTLVDFVLPGGARARIAEVFRFQGDLVCEIRPYYFDPAPVWAAARANGY